MSTPLIIVSAPSGAGKSSLCDRAIKEFDELVDSVSYTTRQPREGESEGKPYHFVSREKFEALKKEDFFIEWAEVHDNFYGTPRHQLEDAWKRGQFLIMDIDVQGARSLKTLYPDSHSIFILPPSFEELERRLKARDEGRTQNLSLRLANARKEADEAATYDFQVTNDDFERAYSEFRKIIEKIVKPR